MKTNKDIKKAVQAVQDNTALEGLKKQHTKTLRKLAKEMGLLEEKSEEEERETLISAIQKAERLTSGVVYMSDLEIGDQFTYPSSKKVYVVVGKSTGSEESITVYSPNQSFKATKLDKVVTMHHRFQNYVK